jgi:hypothetical protein
VREKLIEETDIFLPSTAMYLKRGPRRVKGGCTEGGRGPS